MISPNYMKKLHHVNVIIGNKNYNNFIFGILLDDLNFDIKANPDFFLMERDFFGIDDARNLKNWSSGKPLMGEIKASLIVTKYITNDAQNALLKVLEEPPLGTYIFINLESLGGLLPTFLSRVKILNTPLISETEKNEEVILSKASAFLSAKMKERFALTYSLSINKNKTPMKELINNLEEIYYKRYAKDMTLDNSKSKAIKNILTAKIFASTRGSSPKMLLEWLSCVL